MTPDFDDQLRALFADAVHDLSAGAFAARVSAGVLRQRRRLRMIQGGGVLMTFAALWLLAPDLTRAVTELAGRQAALAELADRTVRVAADSSLLSVAYVYAGAGAAYFLAKTWRSMLTVLIIHR